MNYIQGECSYGRTEEEEKEKTTRRSSACSQYPPRLNLDGGAEEGEGQLAQLEGVVRVALEQRVVRGVAAPGGGQLHQAQALQVMRQVVPH